MMYVPKGFALACQQTFARWGALILDDFVSHDDFLLVADRPYAARYAPWRI